MHTGMSSPDQNRLAIWLVSPYGLASVSTVVFLIAITFPADVYREIIEEPDYMYFDVASLLFFGLCVTSFLAGVWVVNTFFPSNAFVDRPIGMRLGPVKFLLIPLLPLLVVSLLSNVLILNNNPSLLTLMLSQGGNEIKESVELQGTASLSNIYLLGVLWWCIWRSGRIDLTRGGRAVVKSAICLSAFAVVLAATLKLGRGELMPAVTGIGVIYWVGKTARRGANLAFVLKATAAFGAAIACLFILFSFVRGASDSERWVADVVGYSIASYNRLAALLAGRLHYPYQGRGVFLFGFVGFNNMLNAVIPFRELLSWPSFYDAWQSEFQCVARSGLSESAIWASAFGYIFADLGWWSPIFVFFQGLLCGAIWRAIKKGQILGIVLYPWVAFCILFWLGTNYLLDNKFVVLLLDVFALTAYERFFTVKYTPQASERATSFGENAPAH